MRCSLGRGTSATSRCVNSSGDSTMWEVRSCQAVLSLSTTCPATLILNRWCRVIRTESDSGVVYPIDDRYAHTQVRELFPGWWKVQYQQSTAFNLPAAAPSTRQRGSLRAERRP